MIDIDIQANKYLISLADNEKSMKMAWHDQIHILRRQIDLLCTWYTGEGKKLSYKAIDTVRYERINMWRRVAADK